MRAPLAPVETWPTEDAPPALSSREVDPEIAEKPRSASGHVTAIADHNDEAMRRESISQPNPETAGKVVVTSPRRPQRRV
jgi:hypothetical protein